MMNTDKAWEQWGAADPYFGVLTQEKFRGRNLTADAKREFFATGTEHVREVLANIRHHLEPNFTPRQVLDFGCGAGRLLLPFARQADAATGMDVSAAMLAEAQHNAQEAELNNITLLASDDQLSRLDGIFDLVHSYIVFQHIPVSRGEKLLCRLLRRVRPGGVAAIQVPCWRNAPTWRKCLAWSKARVPGLALLANFWAGRDLREAPMQMNVYSLDRLFRLFWQENMDRVFVLHTNDEDYMGAMLFARKNSRN